MSLGNALKTAAEAIPDCLAVGYVDMGTGMVLELFETDQAEPGEYYGAMDALAISLPNLFDGKGTNAALDMLRQAGEAGDDATFGEIIVFSDGFTHVFQRSMKYPGHAVCYICRDSANPGLVLTKSSLSLGSISEAV